MWETIDYYPAGGTCDCRGIYNTLEEVTDAYYRLDSEYAYVAIVEDLKWRILNEDELGEPTVRKS